LLLFQTGRKAEGLPSLNEFIAPLFILILLLVVVGRVSLIEQVQGLAQVRLEQSFCVCHRFHFAVPGKMEPVVGLEPTTDGLQNRCSTTELNWHPLRG
jgi:hypothetical protein